MSPISTKVDIPTFKRDLEEGESKKADLTVEVQKERNKRRYIRREGGFKKGLSAEMLAEAIEFLKEIGVHEEDITHDLQLFRAGRRTGTERIKWLAEVRVPGMEGTEALPPTKITDLSLMRQTIASQAEQMQSMMAQMQEMAAKIENLSKPAETEAEAEEKEANAEVAAADREKVKAAAEADRVTREEAESELARLKKKCLTQGGKRKPGTTEDEMERMKILSALLGGVNAE